MSIAPRQILFALSPETKAAFFPRFAEIAFAEAEHRWLDISGLTPESWEEKLSEIRPEVLVSGWSTPALPDAVAEHPDKLRYVCHVAGSVRFFLPRHLLERGLLATNWGTAASHSVAEHAILLVLGALRGMPRWRGCFADSLTGSHRAATALNTCSLRGRRVGIHGFGTIAREIVALLRPFGVTVSAFSAGVPETLLSDHGVRASANLDDLFSTSDVLIECEALTPHTEGSVTETLLRRLPADAVFVNVGRGPVVDEHALARLAAERRLRVGLDVFSHEPLPGDSLLLSQPEILLSPHIGGPTRDILPSCGELALQNLRLYLTGEIGRMEGVITPEIYDRST